MFDPPRDPWEILPAWRASLQDRRYDFLDRAELEAFLRRFLFDYRIMSDLRQLLTSTDPASRFTDDEVVETIAWKLATKELVIRDSEKKTTAPASDGGGDQKDAQAKKPQPVPAGAVVERKAAAPPPGRLKVLVLDDKGKGVANVQVTGPGAKKTDATGVALYDPLAPMSSPSSLRCRTPSSRICSSPCPRQFPRTLWFPPAEPPKSPSI
jgi:hypothetical protein